MSKAYERNGIVGYTVKDNLRSYGKNIFDTMDRFMSKFPLEYRRLYDKNLETLEFMKCDKLDSDAYNGMYDTSRNVIFYTKSNCLGHELFHVASYDPNIKKSAFERNINIDQ